MAVSTALVERCLDRGRSRLLGCTAIVAASALDARNDMRGNLEICVQMYRPEGARTPQHPHCSCLRDNERL